MENKFGLDFANIHFDFFSEAPVPCVLCDELFLVNHDPQPLLKHLLDTHKLVIGSPKEVPDFRHYIIYWKKLQTSCLTDYCILYKTNTEPDAKESSETFYLLCDKLPEDKNLRETLCQMKLRFMTQQKEEECRDRSFRRPCIYCPAVIGGGVARSFQHLTSDHGFSLGNPDNIVAGAKLLDMMEDALKRLECLHCEKTFKNPATLREHMRKKQHRSLNPRNTCYDRFYLRNYLQPGTPWEEAKKIVLRESEGERESEEPLGEDQLWTDWREESGGGIPAVCLFCSFTTTKVWTTLLPHMDHQHGFPFATLTSDLSFYSKVKLVNFIRKQVCDLTCLSCETVLASASDFLLHWDACGHLALPPTHRWDHPRFLIPVLEDDGLLIHMVDDDVTDEDASSVASSLNDDVVFPEDSLHLPSILGNVQLRQELEGEDSHGRSGGGSSGASRRVFRCFFCAFHSSERGACLRHMDAMHDFNYRKTVVADGVVAQGTTESQVIAYIRAMTECGKCFVCSKSYLSRGALEEHRLLEGHTDSLPHDALQKKWPSLDNDDFLLPTDDEQDQSHHHEHQKRPPGKTRDAIS